MVIVTRYFLLSTSEHCVDRIHLSMSRYFWCDNVIGKATVHKHMITLYKNQRNMVWDMSLQLRIFSSSTLSLSDVEQLDSHVVGVKVAVITIIVLSTSLILSLHYHPHCHHRPSSFPRHNYSHHPFPFHRHLHYSPSLSKHHHHRLILLLFRRNEYLHRHNHYPRR